MVKAHTNPDLDARCYAVLAVGLSVCIEAAVAHDVRLAKVRYGLVRSSTSGDLARSSG